MKETQYYCKFCHVAFTSSRRTENCFSCEQPWAYISPETEEFFPDYGYSISEIEEFCPDCGRSYRWYPDRQMLGQGFPMVRKCETCNREFVPGFVK